MLYPWQTTQWQYFSQQKTQQRLPHAVIITGATGLGKLVLAKHMVASLLCEVDDATEACGHCHSCQLFIAESHPDHTMIEPIEAGKQIKIEQIRRLKDKQELTPTIAKWKTVIICPAGNMNINANNSLLKLLEEPQQNTMLILVTSQAHRLPITILSRCQKIVMAAPEQQLSINWLQQQGSFDQQMINQILPLANWAPLTALAMLQADNDVLQQSKQIEADFKSLLQGQANPVLLAKDWQQYDLIWLFKQLQNMIKKYIITDQNQTRVKRYWHIYDCIIAGIKLTSSPNNINKTLLIEQFMVSVMTENATT